GDGVVHLAGEAGPFRADRFGDGEAGPHLGEGAGGLGEAEHELAQGGSGGARDDAQAGQERGFRGAGVGRDEGGGGEAEDEALKGGGDGGRAPAVDQAGQERGADADVGEGGGGAGGDQEQGAEEGVQGEQGGVAQQEGAEAFPVAEEGVGRHEGDDDGAGDQAGAPAGGGVEEGGGGGEGDHGQAEAEDLAAQGLEGVGLEVDGRGRPGVGRLLGGGGSGRGPGQSRGRRGDRDVGGAGAGVVGEDRARGRGGDLGGAGAAAQACGAFPGRRHGTGPFSYSPVREPKSVPEPRSRPAPSRIMVAGTMNVVIIMVALGTARAALRRAFCASVRRMSLARDTSVSTMGAPSSSPCWRAVTNMATCSESLRRRSSAKASRRLRPGSTWRSVMRRSSAQGPS